MKHVKFFIVQSDGYSKYINTVQLTKPLSYGKYVNIVITEPLTTLLSYSKYVNINIVPFTTA